MKKTNLNIGNILSQALVVKTLENSQNYFISKVFKKVINLKTKSVTICKYSAPKIINKKNTHFILNLFLINDLYSFQNYLKKESIIIETPDKSINNLNVLNNIYPLLIKSNNLYFTNCMIFKSFILTSDLIFLILKLNLIISIIKSIKTINYKSI